MKKTAVALAALVALALPAAASAQLSVGARAGTLGMGGEVSFGVTRLLAVRGGIGFIPYDYNDDFEGVNYTITAPERIWNVGVDLYPFGGGFRISAGVLNRPAIDIAAQGRQEDVEIGNAQYDAELDLQGEISNESETAPYVSLGFGRATGRGFGFFVDLGAAFVGDATLSLSGTCREVTTNQSCPNFDAELAREVAEANAELDDFGSYVKLHPILQLGFRLGL